MEWAGKGPFVSVLKRWTGGQMSDPDAFVDHFITTTGFATGGGAARTRNVAAGVLQVFLRSLVDEVLLIEEASPAQTHYLDGRRNASDAQTRQDIASLETRLDRTPKLDTNWIQTHVGRAIKAADRRYTPDVHVPLPIETTFEGLSHTPAFFERLREAIATVVATADETDQATAAVAGPGIPSTSFRESAARLEALVADAAPGAPLPREKVAALALKLFNDAEVASSAYYRERRRPQAEEGDRAASSEIDQVGRLMDHARERCLALHRAALEVGGTFDGAAGTGSGPRNTSVDGRGGAWKDAPPLPHRRREGGRWPANSPRSRPAPRTRGALGTDRHGSWSRRGSRRVPRYAQRSRTGCRAACPHPH